MSAGRRRNLRGSVLLSVGIVVMVVAILASLSVGARPVAPAGVLDALSGADPSAPDHIVVVTQRLPRTVIGVLAGAALAVAGGLMQGITRNPLADPGLFGVNAGAALAVLAAITLAGVSMPGGFVWFAFAGAAVAATVVYVIGTASRDGSNPAKLALTGAALTAGLTSLSLLVLTTNQDALHVFRFWSVGSLTGRGLESAVMLAPAIVVGLIVGVLSGSSLNLLALGDDTARGLGHGVARTRVVVIVAIVLLCGAATAIAGPLVFIGLVVPHLSRAIVGSDYRWILGTAVPLGAAFLLAADVVGRLIALPGEVEAGLVVAFLGAPVLVTVVLRRSAVAL